MQIRRDYSQPFFGGKSRKKRHFGRWAFVLGLVIGGILLFITTRFDEFQAAAMEVMGLVPTATPFPGELAKQAMDAYVSGDTRTAMTLFDRAVTERPDDISYLYEYGQILIESGSYERAITMGEHAIELNLFDPRGYALKGRALVWGGDASTAVSVALSGQAVDDQFAPLYAVLARAYTELGSLSAALENGEKAVQLDPRGAEARRSYAYALNSAGARDEATAQLEQGLTLNPSFIPLYFELAAQYLALNQDEDAIRLYEQVLLLQPQNARAYLRLCDAYRKTGDFLRGEDFCEKAVQADPAYTAAQFRLGMIKYTNRNFPAALKAFQGCIDSDAENLECYYRLGLTHYYLSLEARTLENIPTPGPTQALIPEGTAARNEMLEQAMMAVTEEKLDQPATTVTPTLPPQPTAQGMSSAEHCDLAWTILQDSLSKAQLTVNSDEMVADIRLGLSLVAQDCPKFHGAAPTLTPSITPTLTLTPVIEDIQGGGATEEVMPGRN